jgi:hypothetical protein
MTISSVSQLWQPTATDAISSTNGSTTGATDVDGPSVSVNVSRPGQLLGELSLLAQSDPTKFKSVTASISQQLESAASSASGPEAAALANMANRFAAASQSGNAADLTPQHQANQGQGMSHRHHHHRAASAESSGQDSLMRTVQGIISSALQSAGVTSPSAASASPATPPSST